LATARETVHCTDIAAIIIRNQDRTVQAYLGGTHFFEPRGMVDRIRAIRSPGSTLKPFIYARAFDAGLAAPNTWLTDAPMRLGTYAPRNFDHEEHGGLTAADALRRSVNRPAVLLLAALGPQKFAASLSAAGTPLVLPRGATPSAALALGGAGISPWGLATLYTALAEDGQAGPLTLYGDEHGPATPICSPNAAKQIATILRAQPPPPGIATDHPIAWKTGTSYGFRDAWAAGFTPGYTVVVWTGRRDGSPQPGITGRDGAAPLLFRLFALLPPEPAIDDAALVAVLAPALSRRAHAAPLRILFPPGDVTLAYDPAAPIDLRAAGGRPPYAWLIDGRPLGARPTWTAAGPGTSHITVLDRDGQAASEDVRLLDETR